MTRKKDRRVEYVPAEPFTRWLNERYEFHSRRLDVMFSLDNGKAAVGPVITALCDEIGWPGDAGVRRLYRHRHGRMETARGKTPDGKKKLFVQPATQWRRDVVEEALHHAGVPFSDLYPEIAAAEDLPLEPAIECWTCAGRVEDPRDAIVNPVMGMCPWCDTQLRYGNELRLAA